MKFYNITLFTVAAFYLSASLLALDEKIIVYKVHQKKSPFATTLSNANAADAAGSVYFMLSNPMGLELNDQDITAFKVTLHSRENPFSGKYYECNQGFCTSTALPAAKNTSDIPPMGTYAVPSGGKWFSFRDAVRCQSPTMPAADSCFSFEVIGTYINKDGFKSILEGKDRTAAAKALQEKFPAVKNLLQNKWIDSVEHKPSSFEEALKKMRLPQKGESDADDETSEDDWD